MPGKSFSLGKRKLSFFRRRVDKRPGLRQKKSSTQRLSRSLSPTRSASMPNEIDILPGSPSSDVSGISATTGLPQLIPQKLRMRPLLPVLSTDGDSLEKSFFANSLKSAHSKSSSSTLRNGKVVFQHSPVVKKDIKEEASSIRKSSFFVRSSYFKRLSDWAFQTIDAECSGRIDLKELYSGLLLVQLNIATYAGPAACQPPTRQYVEELFLKMDTNNMGYLDKEDFIDVMTILCSQIGTRIIVQWTITLLIVPLISQHLLDFVMYLHKVFITLWSEIDRIEESSEYIKNLASSLTNLVVALLPRKVNIFLGLTHEFVESLVPESVLLTIPLAIVSCILGSLVVPYIIFKFDEFFLSKFHARSSNCTRQKTKVF